MTQLLLKLFVKDWRNVKSPNVRKAYGVLASIVGVICNLLISASKIIVGILFFSVAILADGINNLADAASSIVSLIGFKIASKPADKKHPFGHARSEYIAGLIISFVIVIVGFQLVLSSIEKIIKPSDVTVGYLAIIVLSVSILIKFWMMLFASKLGKKINSVALKAVSSDSRNDCIATGAVLVSTIVAMATGVSLDGYIGVAVALFIIISGFKIAKEMLNPLMGEVPDKEIIVETYKKIKSKPEILGVHDLVMHNYGPHYYFASVHVEMDKNLDILKCHEIIEEIEKDVKSDGIHLVIHHDPLVVDDEEVMRYREIVGKIIVEIDETLTFHDLRVVGGETYNNIIFDVVAPAKFKMTELELQCVIQDKLSQVENNCYVVIEMDRDYVEV